MTAPQVTGTSAIGTALLPSVIRTVVPVIVGVLLTGLLKIGIDIDSGAATNVVTTVITALYYALVRYLETKGSAQWGWLLGLAKAPAYSTEGAPSPAADETLVTEVVPDLPSGEEPADDAPGVVVANSRLADNGGTFSELTTPHLTPPSTGVDIPVEKPARKRAPAKKAASPAKAPAKKTPAKSTPLHEVRAKGPIKK